MLIAFFAASLIAAAPLDAPHAAVLTVLAHSGDAAGCRDDQRLNIARQAKIQRLGRVGGDEVVLAMVYDPCICGAQNCPYYAIRLTPGNPRVLFAGFGIDEQTTDHATPLPGVVARMHDSAAIAIETRYAYSGDKYVVTDASRLRWEDKARKPVGGVPVHFAPGASSASLHGKASLGWYDDYSFAANAGQKLLVDHINSRAKTSLTLYGPDNTPIQGLRPGVPFTLPRTGTYHVWIDNGSETDVPYTLTLAIR